MKYNLKRPCENCPFKREAPRGVWTADHYTMLQGLCEKHTSPSNMGTFACHDTRPEGTHACAGWVLWQQEHCFPSLGIRLAMSLGHCTARDIEALDHEVEIFTDVDELAEVNLAAIEALAEGYGACEGSIEPVSAEFEGKLKAVCHCCDRTLPSDGVILPDHFSAPQ